VFVASGAACVEGREGHSRVHLRRVHHPAWSALVLIACRYRQGRVSLLSSILSPIPSFSCVSSIEQIHGIGNINAFEKQKLAEMQVLIVACSGSLEIFWSGLLLSLILTLVCSCALQIVLWIDNCLNSRYRFLAG